MPTYNNLPKSSPAFKGKWFTKLVEDLRLAGMKKRTVYGYVREIRHLADFHETPPEKLAENDVRVYLASFAFNLPCGTYDVRITYSDGPVGQSEIKLSVAGQEKASFRMDEDCNCWRWRRLENIAINAGDRVTLTGKADRGDLARLDFIELIK